MLSVLRVGCFEPTVGMTSGILRMDNRQMLLPWAVVTVEFWTW
jgi:hypothetical protein